MDQLTELVAEQQYRPELRSRTTPRSVRVASRVHTAPDTCV